jgi:hypothetical protein
VDNATNANADEHHKVSAQTMCSNKRMIDAPCEGENGQDVDVCGQDEQYYRCVYAEVASADPRVSLATMYESQCDSLDRVDRSWLAVALCPPRKPKGVYSDA